MNIYRFHFSRILFCVATGALATCTAFAVTPTSARHHPKRKTSVVAAKPVVAAARTGIALQAKAAGVIVAPPAVTGSGSPKPGTARKKGYVQTWDEPTYKDSTANDKVDGEDMVIRKAAADALGQYNGSVVVADPTNGRVLTIVNQPLALSGGFQPCSTVKISVALAALREGMVKRTSPIKFASRSSLDLTDALAFSNNYYFANLGIQLGYQRMNYYAHLFGYGEKAGLNIEGEKPGYYPPAPPANGGMGMLTSFGEEIEQTPLEFAALMSAVANGGTLYWMQYPRNQAEIESFRPEVKRHLDIADLVDTMKPGMRGAVDYGTAKRAKQDDEILGKTGTCSEGRTHLGWFGAFNEGSSRKLVVVVMLTGGRPSVGATASEVAGDFYRELANENYFKNPPALTPASILSPQIIGSR
jgi:membrane peptidoglycan carboxypeptidase